MARRMRLIEARFGDIGDDLNLFRKIEGWTVAGMAAATQGKIPRTQTPVEQVQKCRAPCALLRK